MTGETVLSDALAGPAGPAGVADLRTSPLARRAGDLAAASGEAVRLGELPFRAAVSLRVPPGGEAAARVAAALGTGLPGPGAVAVVAAQVLPAEDGPTLPTRTAAGTAPDPIAPDPMAPERVAQEGVVPERVAPERAVLWLGPDEWLVTGPDGDAPALTSLLTAALADEPGGGVVDVSANRTTVEVTGPAARSVLEKGITLDLHPRAFAAGRVASTTLARTQVILWQTTDEPTYRLLVRNSFAHYLADWLVDAAAEFVPEGAW